MWSPDHRKFGPHGPNFQENPIGDSGSTAYSVTDQILCHRMVHGPNTRPKRTHHVWAKRYTCKMTINKHNISRHTDSKVESRSTSFQFVIPVTRPAMRTLLLCCILLVFCGFLYDVLSKKCVLGAIFRKRPILWTKIGHGPNFFFRSAPL